MTWTGEVQISVNDSGAGIVSVPAASVQAVIGTAASGTAGTVVVTKSLTTLSTTFLAGPLLELAGQVVQAGGTVLAVRAATVTAGAIRGAGTAVGGGVAGAASGTGGVVKLTMNSAHGLVSGAVVTVASVTGTTEANGTWIVNVTDATHLELVGTTYASAWVSGGTVTPKGANVTANASSAAAQWLTGTPNDDYYVVALALNDFTVGTTGGLVSFSLDRGTTFGPAIALGTSATYALKDANGYDTGLTWNAVSGKAVKSGDVMKASTTAPQPDATGIAACLTALRNYSMISGGAGYPIVSIAGDCNAALAANIQTDLNTDASNYFFERAITHARDASPAAVWGGTAETEATWMAAVLADYGAANAPRVSATAGWYNMPTAFPTLFASAPIYRRPLAFAYAARQASIPTQVHAGKVGQPNGGALSQIIVNATSDASDGFVYHNEAANPGFDYYAPGGSGRITAARLRARKPGWYISNPLTLAPAGSDFSLMPFALVMDVACSIAHDALEQFVNADLGTKSNGTLADVDAARVRQAVEDAIDANMTNVSMISGRSVQVDQTQIITQTKKLIVTITIQGRAYVLEVDVTLGFANSLAAAAA